MISITRVMLQSINGKDSTMTSIDSHALVSKIVMLSETILNHRMISGEVRVLLNLDLIHSLECI